MTSIKLSYECRHVTQAERKAIHAILASVGGRRVKARFSSGRKLYEVEGSGSSYQVCIRTPYVNDYGRRRESTQNVEVKAEWPEGYCETHQSPVEIGTEVEINYGAMNPVFIGKVTGIDEDGWVTLTDRDGDTETIRRSEITPYGCVSANGSPIGAHLTKPATC
jgi:hypothetical protein